MASSRLYCAWNDFDVLDEVSDAYALGDFKPGDTNLLWANKQLLNSWGITLEQWRAIDCNKGNSDAITEMNKRIYDVVQVQQEVYETPKTFHTKNGPLHGLYRVRPVRVLLPGETEERILALTVHYITDQASENADNGWRHSTELMYHMDVVCMMFVGRGLHDVRQQGNEEDFLLTPVHYSNLKARDFYLPAAVTNQRRYSNCSDTITLRAVFESCAFESEEEEERIFKASHALQLGSKKIDFICRKRKPACGTRNEQGEERWHRIIFIPALEPGTSTPALMINEYDITQQMSMGAKFSSLSQAQSDLQDFLSVVGHELRTPLNGVIGLAQTIMQDAGCSERTQRSAEWIKSSGDKLAHIVNEMVDAARMQNEEKVKIETKDEVSISEVAQSVIEGLSQNRRVKLRAEIVNHLTAELPQVQGNRVRITQILTNLLSNAIKFTAEGCVTLSGWVEEVEGSPFVRVEVKDTGVGIPQSNLQGIWQPFKQGDMSATRKYEGTGLGLSLVKGLVQAHNGFVGVESRCGGPDSGSVFYFSLPIKQPPSVELPIKQPSSAVLQFASKQQQQSQRQQQLLHHHHEEREQPGRQAEAARPSTMGKMAEGSGGAAKPGERAVQGSGGAGGSGRGGYAGLSGGMDAKCDQVIMRHLLRERSMLSEELQHRSVLHDTELRNRDILASSFYRELYFYNSPQLGARAGELGRGVHGAW